jgi:hypothetical protein
MRVKSHSAGKNYTLRVETNLVRVEITLVRVVITFVSVEVPLCVELNSACRCRSHTMRVEVAIYVYKSHS